MSAVDVQTYIDLFKAEGDNLLAYALANRIVALLEYQMQFSYQPGWPDALRNARDFCNFYYDRDTA